MASAPIQTFLEFFKPVLRTIFFQSHWLLSHITIVPTMDSSERGMNPVEMTIINPRKEYWPSQGSNQRPPVLKSAMLQTELWGLSLMPFGKKPLKTSLEKGIKAGIHFTLSQTCPGFHVSAAQVF